MAEPAPSIMSHVSIGVADFDRAVAFYDSVLATIGAGRVMEHPGAVAYGRQFPEFWVQTPISGKPPTVGEGTHFGFLANSNEEVDRFFKAAMAAGASSEGAPGPREEYGEPYYGAFVRDPDGHKIEAMHWDAELAQKLGMGG